MTMKKATRRGFTLVELMIVVAIIGVLAALAIYGVRRYVYTAKTAEAKTALGRMSKDASSSYNGENMLGTVLPLGEQAQGSNQFCVGTGAVTAIGTLTVPSNATYIQGKKYQSSPTDWEQATLGFSCLGFSVQDPQYYAYGYVTACSGAAGACDQVGDDFIATALGDLDGDTDLSTYTMKGEIQTVPDSTANVLTIAPNFEEADPLE